MGRPGAPRASRANNGVVTVTLDGPYESAHAQRRAELAAAATRLPLGRTIRADLATFAELKGANLRSPGGWADLFTIPGVWAGVLFRVSNALHERGLRPFSRLVYFLNYVLFACEMFPGAKVGPGLALFHPVGTAISSTSVVGKGLRVVAGVRIGGGGFGDPSKDGGPTIGDDVWILDGAKVLGPLWIGDRALLAACALPTRDVPAEAVVVGIPGRVLRYRFDAADGRAGAEQRSS